MLVKIIESISRTENSANEIIRISVEKERRMIEEAEIEKLKQVREAKKNAEKEAEMLIRQADEASAEKVKELRARMEEEKKRIINEYEGKIDKAAALMMERIVWFYGNC